MFNKGLAGFSAHETINLLLHRFHLSCTRLPYQHPEQLRLRCLSNSLIRFSASWMHLQQLWLSASLNKSFYVQKTFEIYFIALEILDQKKHDRLESRAHFKVSSIADLLKRSAEGNFTISAGNVQPTCAAFITLTEKQATIVVCM